MSAPRRFNYDQARERYAAGESINDLAARYGVSYTAVYRVVVPRVAERMAETHAAWQRSGECPDCGAQTTRRGKDTSSRCIPCAVKRVTTSVRDTTLRCQTCREWKPDEAFPRGNRAARRNRHQQCRSCLTEAKRQWRERNKVPCSHGCGTLVDAKNRRTPDKPPECRPCALKRIHDERRQAA